MLRQHPRQTTCLSSRGSSLPFSRKHRRHDRFASESQGSNPPFTRCCCSPGRPSAVALSVSPCRGACSVVLSMVRLPVAEHAETRTKARLLFYYCALTPEHCLGKLCTLLHGGGSERGERYSLLSPTQGPSQVGLLRSALRQRRGGNVGEICNRQ